MRRLALPTITGERVVTSSRGFNPTWQRHVAAYRLCADFLPPGRVLDLGCGVGHSYAALAPRRTVGVDLIPAVLAGQQRPTCAADMRRLPFADGSFDGVVSVQSIEHIPDALPALHEIRRVLCGGGVAVLVTPNRLTFGCPDEIIDPYHFVEYDAAQLAAVCGEVFDQVRVLGVGGSARYLALVAAEHRRLDQLLRADRWRLRQRVPRRARQVCYDLLLTAARRREDPRAAAITPEDFHLVEAEPASALDLVAVLTTP